MYPRLHSLVSSITPLLAGSGFVLLLLDVIERVYVVLTGASFVNRRNPFLLASCCELRLPKRSRHQLEKAGGVLLTVKLSLFVFGCRQEVNHGLVLVGSLFSKLHFLETFPLVG
jgi:hypothetical protein